MFNNPFESFHNTVSKAKAEREQLDGLLTISTPREGLLVVACAILLVVLFAWLIFAEEHKSVILEGLLVAPKTETESVQESSLKAHFRDTREVAQQIETGMEVTLLLADSNGGSQRLNGKMVRFVKVTGGGAADLQPLIEASCYLLHLKSNEVEATGFA